MSRVDLSIFDKLRWILTQYLKFLAGQNDAQAIFLEGQNGVFQNFYASKPGFTGQTWALRWVMVTWTSTLYAVLYENKMQAVFVKH